MDNTRKIALVTGAGSGVGAAASRALAVENFTVVLVGRRQEPLDEVADSLAEIALPALAVAADISDPDDVSRLFARVRAEVGRLDVLFNNAGMRVPSKPIEDILLEEWQGAIATNLTGSFLCTQHAVRLMKEQDPRGGRIINNGSLSAHVPRPHSAAYTATKHAITGLTKATSLDCRSSQICVGQIDIGNAATDMSARLETGVLQPNGDVVPEPRFDPGHVAAGVVYLATLPLDVNVPSFTVMANEMPYVGRG